MQQCTYYIIANINNMCIFDFWMDRGGTANGGGHGNRIITYIMLLLYQYYIIMRERYLLFDLVSLASQNHRVDFTFCRCAETIGSYIYILPTILLRSKLIKYRVLRRNCLYSRLGTTIRVRQIAYRTYIIEHTVYSYIPRLFNRR